MADLVSREPLGADDVDLVHSVHRSQVLANESSQRPYTEPTRKESENASSEEKPKLAQADVEDKRVDESLGTAAMAFATLSSGTGTVQPVRDGQQVFVLKLEKDDDTKLTLFSETVSPIEGASDSVRSAPGERFQSAKEGPAHFQITD
ncbi:hypothetical protein EC968_000675 [Mortierella alpina]|nr:hypothetical protein EC968_000675 [Mortierella alpina]